MSIGTIGTASTRALRSGGAAAIALATACTLTIGTAGGAAADSAPVDNVAVDLPLPPGATSSYPAGVNDNGVIVGSIGGPDNLRLPVRWNAALTPTTLALLPGDTTGSAEGVSADGTAVGHSGSHLVRWAPDGTVTELKPLPGDTGGTANVRGVGRTGVVVGESVLGQAHHAVKWGPDGRPVALAPVAGDPKSVAVSVNGSGTVVGMSYTTPGYYHAIRWNPDGSAVALDPNSAYPNSWVYQINDAGTVLGEVWSTKDVNFRAVTWNATGTVTEMARAGAHAMNASGTAVGQVRAADLTDCIATKWSPDGTATALDSYFDCTRAVAVNDAGVAVGATGTSSDSDLHRYALRWEADGSLTELDTVPETYSSALFVNNAGLTVGIRTSFPAPNDPTNIAVIWRP